MSVRFPLAQRFTHRKVEFYDWAYELRRHLGELYPDVEDISAASPGDLWQIIRDLTLAIDRIAKRNESEALLFGPQKMELALDVLWSFIELRGGIEALRAVLVGGRPRGLKRWLGRWVLTPEIIERGMRAALEFAVAELRSTRRKEAV